MKIAIVTYIRPASVLHPQLIKAYNLRPDYSVTTTHNFVGALARQEGCDVHVITMTSEFTQDFTYEKNGVTYHFLRHTSKYSRLFTFYESDKWKIHRFLRVEQFDIVHGQGINIWGYFAVTSGIPNILSIHIFQKNSLDSFKLHYNRTPISVWYAFIAAFQQKITSKRVRNIIISSSHIKQQTLLNYQPKQIFDIENAISNIFFKSYSDESADYGLYVGTIDERKSTIELLRAVEESRNVRLKIISNTVSGVYYNKVISFIRENSLSDRVDLLGPKKNDDVVDIMRKSDYLVLPSMKEGAPLVISEAMAVGRPVIASNIDGIPLMIDDSETGFLVEPGNIEMLVEKMELLSKDKKLCAQMGTTAKEVARKRWHPDTIAVKTMSAYEKVLSVQI